MDAHAVHLAMAALVGASIVAVSAYYMHRKTLTQLLEFARTVEPEGGPDDGDSPLHSKRRRGGSRKRGNGGYRRGSGSLPDVTAISGGIDGNGNGLMHVEGIPAGLPRLQTLREGKSANTGSFKRNILRPTSPKSPVASASAFESVEGSDDEDDLIDGAKLDATYLHTNGNAGGDGKNPYETVSNHVNTNGEQMAIAASSMNRSKSISGDLHGVQPDPIAADILRKEPEQEIFARLRITPMEAPSPDEVESYVILQECLEMRKRYVFQEAVAPWEKEVISDPCTPKPNPDPFLYRPEAKSDHYFEMQDGVIHVYPNKNSKEELFPVADATAFFTDLHQILRVIAAGNIRTLCHHRLNLLEQKFNLHLMLNADREFLAQKSAPHRDFYNVRKVDTHVHHSACMNQKHLLRFIKSKLRKEPDEVVIFRDGTYLTLKEVFAEVSEDTAHGYSRYQQIQLQADRARLREEEDFKNNQSTYLAAIADSEDAPDEPSSVKSSPDDLFGEIDIAIALKRKEFVNQGLLKPNPAQKDIPEADNEELQPDEVDDVEEIDRLKGLAVNSDESPGDGDSTEGGDLDSNSDSSFDLDFDSLGKSNKPRIVEPKFKMSLAELLDESKVVPVSVYGNLEVEISGIQHDSRLVTSGNLFVCCVGSKNDGHMFLSEADKRGAVAVVASKEIDIQDTLGCKALVIVEDTNAVLATLAASFYKYPSKNMAVIGICGTYGKTTTTYLVKSMYEAMGLRTGMFNDITCYVHGDNKLDLPYASLDAVLVQNSMAKMLCNGTESVVFEASSCGLAQGKYDEVDFDVAVFTNLVAGDEEKEDRDSNAKLFSRMVDPERHRKVVNIDDPNAASFVSLGSPDVPVVTFAMENKNADVHPLKFELSLFETQVLVNTPAGILEISSGLLCRHNIYNILAAVAVGIAVGAPLEDIVRGIEEVDAVPGRCELIDEEQAFGVIVDYARTPDALSRLLDSVRELQPRRIITVIGCCGEDERGKRPLMTKIATEKSEVTMLTSDNPKNEDPLDILDDMLAGVGWTMLEYLKYGENDYYPPLPNRNRLFLHDIRRIAVRATVAMGEEGDVVVVAGKGHETYDIEGEKRDFFDDREECREALQYVDELHQAGIDTSEFPWRLPESH